MNVRYFLFLSLGLERENKQVQQYKRMETSEKLLEPDGARTCRRNILALAGIVVLAGVAGVDPSDLSVFGVKPSGGRGVLVLGLAVILAHVYWYVLRYYHLMEDGVIEQDPSVSTHGLGNLRIFQNNFRIVRKRADLFANYAAFIMTICSWCVIASWMIGQ